MAGPEDCATTSTSSNHASTPDQPDLALQHTDDSLLNEKVNVLLGDSSRACDTMAFKINNDCNSGISKNANAMQPEGVLTSEFVNTQQPERGLTSESADVPQPEVGLKIDLRNGKAIKTCSTAPQPSTNTVSQPMCESNKELDDFDVGIHHHLFYIEDDDENGISDEESDDDTFLDTKCDNKNTRQEQECGNTFKIRDLLQEDETQGQDSEGKIQAEDGCRTTPQGRVIPPLKRANTSPILTMCRHSHTQLVTRCQLVSTCHDTNMAASCPAAFSPLWSRVMSPVRTVQRFLARKPAGRPRRSTISVCETESLAPRSVQSQSPPAEPVRNDDPNQPGFVGRSRSYSESDVQQLLIAQVSNELRRIGDEFNHSRGRRLTTVSESALEDNVYDM